MCRKLAYTIVPSLHSFYNLEARPNRLQANQAYSPSHKNRPGNHFQLDIVIFHHLPLSKLRLESFQT